MNNENNSQTTDSRYWWVHNGPTEFSEIESENNNISGKVTRESVAATSKVQLILY